MLFIDKIGDVLRKSIQDVDMNNASIVEENLAVGVHKATTGILVFPNLQILHDSLEKHQWILESKSGILLDTSTLGMYIIFILLLYIVTRRSFCNGLRLQKLKSWTSKLRIQQHCI